MTKRPKAPRGARIKRVVVEERERDRPQPVRVDGTKDNRPKAKPGSGNDLIQRGIAERSFI